MAHIINLKTVADPRGNLTVVEDVLPFDIKRAFFIYDVGNSSRGGHCHHSCVQALVCVNGSCVVLIEDGVKVFHLNSPSECLIIEPGDWREMFDFTEDAVLVVFSSENYNKKDYIYKREDR